MELKPCPFCGWEAEIRYHPSCMRDPSSMSWEVGCSICDARVGNTIYAIGKTRDEAITDWNTRAERTCKAEWRANGWGAYTRHCGECGADLDCDTRNTQHYCPNCGVKVVE